MTPEQRTRVEAIENELKQARTWDTEKPSTYHAYMDLWLAFQHIGAIMAELRTELENAPADFQATTTQEPIA
jgi:hypothetical protein